MPVLCAKDTKCGPATIVVTSIVLLPFAFYLFIVPADDPKACLLAIREPPGVGCVLLFSTSLKLSRISFPIETRDETSKPCQSVSQPIRIQ